MAEQSKAFTPPINRVIDNDNQIVRIKTDNAEIGSRPSATPSDIRNDMTIVHVGSSK